MSSVRYTSRDPQVLPFLDGNRDVFHVLALLVLGSFTLLIPMTSALVSPLLAVPLCALIAFWLANYAGREAPAILIFGIFFQNLFVSLISSGIEDGGTFNLVRGFVFLETVVVWLVLAGHFLQARDSFSPIVQRFMLLGFAMLVIIGLYVLLGLVLAGSGAIIYARNITTPLLLFQIALVTSCRRRLDIGAFLTTVVLIMFTLGYLELLNRPLWLTLSNSQRYWDLNFLGATANGTWEKDLKESGFVYVNIYDYFRITLLNSPYFAGIEIFRAHGPNMHAISYGYALAFAFLWLCAGGRPFLALLAVPLLVFASAKGAIIQILFILTGWALCRLFGARLAIWLLIGLLAAYTALGIVTGLRSGDYHVIGFMGGVFGFLKLPVGHGIGVGGNLNNTTDVLQWQEAQATGAFDGAVESAIGVLLYQMGVAAILLLGYYALVIRAAWRVYARTGLLQHGMATWGCLVILVNGVFQEEALFSPLAMGLMICLAGIVIGSAERTETEGQAG